MARLQAEKNDLVAMNSELQLKVEQGSGDDDFIEVIRVPVSCKTHSMIQKHIYLNDFIQHGNTRGLFQTGPLLTDESDISQILTQKHSTPGSHKDLVSLLRFFICERPHT